MSDNTHHDNAAAAQTGSAVQSRETQRIVIDVATQTLCCYASGQRVHTFSVSTSRYGIGQENGSYQTPIGRHVIRAKIGTQQPPGAVFVGRRPTGEVWCSKLDAQFPERDWILSRILWLSGSERGINRLGSVDSMRRYIYIHGTPESQSMGQPASHGCVRMTNADVIELYDWARVGTSVDICENASQLERGAVPAKSKEKQL